MPTLLVACDYDGTLAEIVEDPTKAHPHRESIAALRSLATFPDTHVAVISGRSLRDLAALSRLPTEVHLVGSHGSEFDVGFTEALTPAQTELRRTLTAALERVAATHETLHVERKPAGAALHYRRAPDDIGLEARDAALAAAAELESVQIKEGKKVVEVSVVATDKGTAVERLRHDLSSDAVVFFGDDRTDEDAFAVLTGPDVGVKVGSGETLASLRVVDPDQVARALARLCELRRIWQEGGQPVPIEHHSLLSDHRTVALLTPDARITWMCHPRADSSALFAELIGGPHAGYFSVSPSTGAEPISQRYLPDTMVVETRWPGLTVIDYLDVSDGRSTEPAGRTNLIRVLEGSGLVDVEFAPRLDFGRAPTALECGPDGVTVLGVQQDICLRSSGADWVLVADGVHQTACASLSLDDGPQVLELCFDGVSSGGGQVTELDRRGGTALHWRQWVDRLHPPEVERDLVVRSALAIKAMCHEPTGAVLAAATTSLPEDPGGVRNWDYRYCWPRDAALGVQALVRLGSRHEARGFLGWMVDRVAHLPGPEQLRPLYPLSGDEHLPEAVLPTLHGYLGSRPVRIGNAADQQVQLDVFGPVVDLIHSLAVIGEPVTDQWWQLVQDMVVAVARRWHEPDHGIWEERRPPRHHVHSKVMCWMAVDRGIAIGELVDRPIPSSWYLLRHAIAGDVISNGWNEDVRAFTIAYGDEDLDAATLWLGLSGLMPMVDARYVSTVKAIERELRQGSIVYRYRLDDGLPGSEGGFLICTAWLIEAYVAMGQQDDAELLFDRYLDRAGATGLLSEQYDPATGRMLGNHPQVYSHLGLVSAALAIERGRSSVA